MKLGEMNTSGKRHSQILICKDVLVAVIKPKRLLHFIMSRQFNKYLLTIIGKVTQNISLKMKNKTNNDSALLWHSTLECESSS